MIESKGNLTMKFKIIICLVLTIVYFLSCGEGVVTVDEKNYEPKIVVEGYLNPTHSVQVIRITRNIPMNTDLQRLRLFIDNADVKLIDLSRSPSTEYIFGFNQDSLYYEYTGSDLSILNGGTYRLEVHASIEGKNLSTSSTTTVPDSGFRIRDDLSSDSLYFNKRENGSVKKPKIIFQRSPKTEFYAFSFVALNASTSTFIYNHPFINDIDEKDVEENLKDFKYSMDTIFNTPETEGMTTLEVESYHTFFYGWYRAVAYAGDQNYKDFFLTQSNVMEMDGNMHEPKMHFDGDGIGVFGSVIADTLYFKILEDE